MEKPDERLNPMKDYKIELGTPADLPEIITFYDELTTALEKGSNYPLWQKGIYPNADTAREGIEDETIYLMKIGEKMAGSVILDHAQPAAYRNLTWQVEARPEEIMVIHTLAIHPDFWGQGRAIALIRLAEELAAARNLRAIRLDTSLHNLPAHRLYQKCGFTLIGIVDLGFTIPGLEQFYCFEKIT